MAITFDTLTELINDARAAREKAEAELALAQAQVEDLRRKQDELREEEDAYTSTLTRRFPEAQPDLAPVSQDSFDFGLDTPEHVNWVTLPRTVAVERAIAEITKNEESASPAQIEQLLRRFGRQDDRDQIGGAVAHLNRTGKIQSIGRAQWALVSEAS